MNRFLARTEEKIVTAICEIKDRIQFSIHNLRGRGMPAKTSRSRNRHQMTTTYTQSRTRAGRRSQTKLINPKRFTAIVAIVACAVMVPVIVLAVSDNNPAASAPDQVSATDSQGVLQVSENAALSAAPAGAKGADSAAADAAQPDALSDETLVAEGTVGEAAEPEYIVLTAGMNDPAVEELQERLMELNYMDEDQPTDYFGPATLSAVQAFQRKNDLEVDGAAGIETQEVIFSDSAKEYTAALGAEGADVSDIQMRLAQLGYDVNDTGYFGEDTEKAVRYFQRMNGLTDDGSVGGETKEVLFSDDAECSEEMRRAQEREQESSNNGGGSGGSSGNRGGGSSGGGSGNGGSSGGGGGSSGGGGNAPSADSGSVEALINAATAQVGKPYATGGKGPDSFDCSGLVYYALKQSGHGVGYMTSGDWASSGYPSISWDNLQRGDIVCVSGHVGIYLGGGDIVDASTSSGQVVIRNMGSWFRSRFICGKRVL